MNFSSVNITYNGIIKNVNVRNYGFIDLSVWSTATNYLTKQV